jgi:hypothetical protein
VAALAVSDGSDEVKQRIVQGGTPQASPGERREMNPTGTRPFSKRRSIVSLLLSAAALALSVTPLASAQATGSVTGTGTYNQGTTTLTVNVTGTPQLASGSVLGTFSLGDNFVGEARCLQIDATASGGRASIAGVITGGTLFFPGGFRGFEVTIYDNTPTGGDDEVSDVRLYGAARTSCGFDLPRDFTVEVGDYTIEPIPAGGCPSGDEDDDGLNDSRESLFSTLLRQADSDRDGVVDGNDDSNRNGEDDEDEDDDEDDGCPDEDSDGDGEDDEDEDDD